MPRLRSLPQCCDLEGYDQATRQHWRVSDVACGNFNDAHFQRFLVDAYAYSTPNGPLEATMLAGILFSFVLGFDAGNVDQQMQRAASHHDTEGSRSAFFLQRHRVLKSGTALSKPPSRRRPPTKPVVCLIVISTKPSGSDTLGLRSR